MGQIEVVPVSGGVGVEVHNVDIKNGIDAGTFDELRAAFVEHGLIFLRDQDITPDEHIAFAERWGEININRFFPRLDGYDQIATVTKEPDQTTNIGGGWHTDHSYDHVPAMGSILIARETPPVGGDTLFACMYTAYDTLSDGLKQTLEDMKAVHSSRHIFGEQSSYRDTMKDRFSNPEDATQDAVHPVVITHPKAGARRFTSIRVLRCILTAGRRQKANRCLIIYTPMLCNWNTPPAFNGHQAPSPFGTIVAHGIMH